VGESTSLALDSDGYAHISYRDTTNGDLKYAAFNGTGWDVLTIDSMNAVGGVSSMGIDSNGYVHIGYYDTTNQDLKYAYFNGTSWNIQVVDSVGNYTGFYPSLGLDSQGNPYISYTSDLVANPFLKLAYFNGSGWEIQVISTDLGTFAGQPRETSLGIYNDYVYITYAGVGGYLGVITNAPQGFVDEPSLNILALIIFVLVIVHSPWSMVHGVENRYK